MQSLDQQIRDARAEVNRHVFGTSEWEGAMQVVRALVQRQNDARAPEEFCSVDSGIHRTRLSSGRVIA